MKDDLKVKASKAIDDARVNAHAAYDDASVAVHNTLKDAREQSTTKHRMISKWTPTRLFLMPESRKHGAVADAKANKTSDDIKIGAHKAVADAKIAAHETESKFKKK